MEDDIYFPVVEVRSRSVMSVATALTFWFTPVSPQPSTAASVENGVENVTWWLVTYSKSRGFKDRGREIGPLHTIPLFVLP